MTGLLLVLAVWLSVGSGVLLVLISACAAGRAEDIRLGYEDWADRFPGPAGAVAEPGFAVPSSS